jgi:hypothetical protein
VLKLGRHRGHGAAEPQWKIPDSKLKYSFLTYNTEGRPTLNIANLSAYYASTAVSSAWLPGHHIMGGYTFSNASEQIALSVPVNLLQEFWPEVRHYVLRRH